MARILVVDDELSYRKHMSLILTRDGHDVETASNRKEAIEITESFNCEVLFVDWMLKDQCNGLDVARTLQAQNPDLITIFITGFPIARLQNKARAAGIERFLEKPFDVDTLRKTLAEALG